MGGLFDPQGRDFDAVFGLGRRYVEKGENFGQERMIGFNVAPGVENALASLFWQPKERSLR